MVLNNPLSFPALLVLLSISILQPTHALINGKEAAVGEFPATVDIRNGSDTSPFCAGTLVDNRHIVTVVRCVTDYHHLVVDGFPTLLPPENVKVYVGSVSAQKGIRHEVESLHLHPDYNVNVTIVLNNIAVIKLKKPVQGVVPAELPTKNPTVGQTVTLAGWGYTDVDHKHAPAKLQKVTLKVVDTKECKKEWEKLGEIFRVFHNHIEGDGVFCALSEVKGAGAAQGDLGGTVVLDGHYVGYSLLSQEGDPSKPQVLASVKAYKDFIEGVKKLN